MGSRCQIGFFDVDTGLLNARLRFPCRRLILTEHNGNLAPGTPPVAPPLPDAKPKPEKEPNTQGPAPQGLFSFDEP